MINKISKSFLFIFIFSLFSCDILRFSLFEVSSWSPGGGYHSDSEKINVSLTFTQDPDRGSVERNFSLTGNGSRIKGTFLWNGRSVTFSPLTPLEANTDYTINLSSDAHNTKGLSMDEAFIRDFTTRQGNERPVLLFCYPQMYEAVDNPRTEVELAFSIPVSLSALYSSVSFNPSMTGSWRLENNDTLAVFTPVEPWSPLTRYEIRLSTSFTDNNGMNIGNDFISVFTVGTDTEPPFLLAAQRITKNGEYVDLGAENEGWEKEDKLFLVFSEQVDWITVKNNLSAVAETAHDIPSLILDSETGKEFIFEFDAFPAYESRFSFRLNSGVKDNAGNESKDEYIFKIFANGKNSKPPALIGFRMPLAPGDEEDLQLFYADTESIYKIIPISDEFYPSKESVPTWIELYFDTIAGIDIFSVMEFFRIDTSNNVLSFSPQLIKTENFSAFDPQTGWEEYQRVEIAGTLTNSVNFGVINIRIAPGLRDSFGNKNEKLQEITVNK